jgi:hypothetical protein
MLKPIDNHTLGLVDKDNNIIARHKPRWTKFDQFKRVKENLNVIKESETDLANETTDEANIYCLDDHFYIIWTIKKPFEKDSFPNPIVWDTSTDRRQTENGYLTLETIDNSNTFICSSWKGITVTVAYETGQIITS